MLRSIGDNKLQQRCNSMPVHVLHLNKILISNSRWKFGRWCDAMRKFRLWFNVIFSKASHLCAKLTDCDLCLIFLRWRGFDFDYSALRARTNKPGGGWVDPADRTNRSEITRKKQVSTKAKHLMMNLEACSLVDGNRYIHINICRGLGGQVVHPQCEHTTAIHYCISELKLCIETWGCWVCRTPVTLDARPLATTCKG